MSLTIAQIIGEGLSQAGRTDLTSNARLWLKNFLEKMYQTQDFGWLAKTSDDRAVSQGASLPADFVSAISATLGTDRSPLSVVQDPAEWDYVRQGYSSTTTGNPSHVYIDRLNKTATFYPTPSSGLTWNLHYQHLPTLPDHTTSAADGNTPVWQLPFDILVHAVYCKALQYNDDSRVEADDQRLGAMVMQAKMNNMHNRAGSSRMKMGKSFRKRF